MFEDGLQRPVWLVAWLSLVIGAGPATSAWGASDPIGSVTAAEAITCPSGGVTGNNSCFLVAIQGCPGSTTFIATVKVTTPSVISKGVILFTGGGGGGVWYDTGFTFGSVVVNAVVQAGFTAVQTNFSDIRNLALEPSGWLTGPATDGPRALACRYATLANWAFTSTNPLIHPTGTPMCATGNSGGAGAIAYALAHYGLGSIFSMVELTSGPPFARIDHGCICDQPPTPTSCGKGSLSQCYFSVAAQFVDPSYSAPICTQAEATHDQTNAQLFLHDSVASTDATLAYPNTDVHVIFGGQDPSAAPSNSLNWVNVITSVGGKKVTPDCVGDAPHPLPDALDAATKIANDVTQFCTLQQ